MSEVSLVPTKAKLGTEVHEHDWSWVEESIWTERMLTVLGNGIKGGKWYSLIDKVYRPSTLHRSWQGIAANKGAAGVNGKVSNDLCLMQSNTLMNC